MLLNDFGTLKEAVDSEEGDPFWLVDIMFAFGREINAERKIEGQFQLNYATQNLYFYLSIYLPKTIFKLFHNTNIAIHSRETSRLLVLATTDPILNI